MSAFDQQSGGQLGLDKHTEQPNTAGREQPAKISLPHAISSEDLLRGQASVTIAHHGAMYRLQTTRQGKLILTK